VRARRSENVSIRQIASCCHEDNARTGSSRSSHACSSHGRGSYSKQPCITPIGEQVIELYHTIEELTRTSARQEFRAIAKLVR
jgi:hypothetical protein